jgi:hypothetical protein
MKLHKIIPISFKANDVSKTKNPALFYRVFRMYMKKLKTQQIVLPHYILLFYQDLQLYLFRCRVPLQLK